MTTLRRVCEAPDVYLADDFATAEECLHVERRGGHWEFIEELEIPTLHDRCGFSFELPIDGDPVLEELRARIEKAVGLTNDLPDTFRFRRYSPGEGHPPHVDCYEEAGALLVATAIVYLNAPQEGGATVFEDRVGSPLRVEAARGRLAVWFNYRADGTPEPTARHAGELVMTGTKATVTYFIYAPAKRVGYRP